MIKKLRIKSKNGIRHAAVFSDPTGSKNTPVVILAAGSNSGKDLAYTSTMVKNI